MLLIEPAADLVPPPGAVRGVAYCCMGLRYPAGQVNELLAPVGQQEGAAEATRQWLLRLGCRRLGEPPPGVLEGLAAVRGLERREQLAARVLKADTWPEVLALH